MDKNAIKKFAIWARKELIARVTQRAYLYGVDGEQELDAEQKEVNGRLLSAVERRQRRTLVNRVKEKGFESVMDEAAYTWFNRFAALRYMEVNGVLPTRVRVFTNSEGAFQPQILTECLTMDRLEGLNKEIVFALKEQDATDELYKYLLITQCNALGTILPAMFEQIEDYTELLLPDNLLRQGSVIEQMVTSIPEDDWRDAVQIIGWLYQYYNSEPKDAVFAALKKNVKVSKENIPAATQLFTPDWIVRYMVENSLGRIWIEHKEAEGLMHNGTFSYDGTQTLNGTSSEEASSQYEKDFAQRMDWKYYLPEAKQEPDVAAELKKLRAERKDLAPTDIKVIDPCMGSGHILVYAFDVLVQIYKDAGYSERSIPELILQNNLYGLDIDDRAYQLAYFAVMMRAWHYNHRILRKHIEPHLCAIQESNGLSKWSDDAMDMSGNQLNLENQFIELADYLIDTFQDAKEYGSILTVKEANYDGLLDYIEEIQNHGASDLAVSAWVGEIADKMPALIKQAKIMSEKYDVCVTNPPYMGSGMNKELSTFVKKNFADYKGDLFSVSIVRCLDYTKKDGFLGFLSPYVWMFIASYEKLRQKFIKEKNIETLIQFEYSAFSEATVPICAFTLRNCHTDGNGCYLRLTDYRGGMEIQRQKALEAITTHDKKTYFESNAGNFKKIPGSPIAYWLGKNIFSSFDSLKMAEFFTIRNGISTGDNKRYLRLWSEVASKEYWKPCNKGGIYRKWYGNNEYVVYWKDNGHDIRTSLDEKGRIKARLGGLEYSFSKGIEMSRITSGKLAFRYSQGGFVFESSTNDIFAKDSSRELFYVLGYCNSIIVQTLLDVMNPTINIMPEDLRKLPFLTSDIKYEKAINSLVSQNISFARIDWNSFETSWDFSCHPLLPSQSPATIAACYDAFQVTCELRGRHRRPLLHLAQDGLRRGALSGEPAVHLGCARRQGQPAREHPQLLPQRLL